MFSQATEAELPDLSDESFDLENLPLRPLNWTLLVQPLEAKKTSAGGIDLSATERAQDILATVGELIALGPQAFKGKSTSGCDLSVDPPVIGDWVAWPKFCGQEFRLRDGRRLISLNDTDLIAVAKRPQDLVIYV